MNKTAETSPKRPIGEIFILIVTLLGSTEAHAYVDPGSGSVIVTTILGFIAAISYTLRKYFYKIKRFFSKEKNKND